jgi:hypothetical protein
MSAFGGKADITVCGNPLSRSLLGAKRTCPFALHMSANDPKQTFAPSDIQQMLIRSPHLRASSLLSWRDERLPFFNDINRVQFDGLVSRAFIVNGAVGKC